MSKLKKAAPWALPAALTAVAVVWAVAAIGDTLTAQAHPVFAYSVAVLYDAVWLYALAQETAHRRQGSNARLPKVIGWVFLPLTVAVLAVHGLLAGDVLAAVVGALIPVLAKVTLVMAIDRDATRISARAQAAIDRTRAATRDRIAVSRAVAAARADETKAAADIVKGAREAEAKAVTVTHDAFEKYAEVIDQHPLPDVAELPGLVSDDDLEALLSGGVPEPVPALGTGGSVDAGDRSGADDGTPPTESAREANNRAVALLAAQLYATDPPPSKRKFRAAMRAEMNARGLTGSWDTIDALYDREKALTGRNGGEK
ncbi:hypothetical protein ACG2OD_32135 [Streptomyces sp. PDY-4]|uniref:DUF2637 domain-containing protein n=1 Tax=Streptomyces fungicidicus TaxID=68203 RepID=A0A494UN86_9ACTN|nr:hypothetical protein [Streptomyces fungicidicus]AYL34837.1 hypothetical protein CNQ36_05000 [Streptomyces fungicidicus]